MDSSAVAMRLHVIDYLAGAISLDDLKERLIDATWGNEDADKSDERAFALDVELVLAEASSGYLTPEDMRSDLQALVDRAALRVGA